MKQITLLPNMITAFGLSCGLFVIFKMTMTENGNATYPVLLATTGILLVAAVADLLDGALARAMKIESEFGGVFDSLGDAVSFGVAPSVIAIKSLSLQSGTPLAFLVTIAATIFTICGVLRLVRFNISNLQARGNKEHMDANKKHFTGLPIPAGAAAAVSGNLILVSEEFQNHFFIDDETRAWIMIAQMITLGYFMVSQWKFPSLKTLRLPVASFQVLLTTVVSAMVIFYGILHYFAIVFFLASWGYLIIAWLFSLTRIIFKKKAQASTVS
ncbi:MAG: CDP-alcohol phosphatidyltransferase family protein [Chlamydiales bacterium]|nr:CDP-alcohol phosphatidyltransferase family protein [Chlamydiales bacterium]